MAQPSEIYVDPAINADSGTGTSGDPFGDLEYAIEQTTHDTTNGTRVNIKAGTDEVLAAALQTALADTVTTPAWVGFKTAPIIFQGYTTTAGDGGKGGISGGGSVGIMNGAVLDYVLFVDLHLHNCGSQAIIDLDNFCSVINCELDNTTGDGIHLDADGLISGCYLHNIGGVGAELLNTGLVTFCYFLNETNDFSAAITLTTDSFADRNLIKIDGASDGIRLGDKSSASHNSIWSNAGTGKGFVPTAANKLIIHLLNNLVEGFSGAGGVGFDLSTSGTAIYLYGGNAAYDNTTEYSAPNDYVILELGGAASNETLSASPFTDAANGDFSPVNTGNVKEGSLPADFADGAI
jgi:hypothetical protein